MRHDDIKVECILRDIRNKRGYTQTQLADAIGVSKNAISDYERGIMLPKLDVLIAICETLCCHIEHVIKITIRIRDCTNCYHCYSDYLDIDHEGYIVCNACLLNSDIIFIDGVDYDHRVVCSSYKERPYFLWSNPIVDDDLPF